jgi:hypothetical protein
MVGAHSRNAIDISAREVRMSTDKETGGQAFPLPCSVLPNGMVHWAEQGMTLRDYFAATALQGIAHDYHPEIDADKIAAVAYRIADAMIRARSA